MKDLVLAALATALLGSVATAQDTTSLLPAPEKDPFVGTWQANQEKSRPKLKGRDASYRRTIKREGDDLVFSSQIGSSHPSKHAYKIRCDGRLHPVPSGSRSCTYITTNTIEGESINTSDGIEYWSEEISGNGQEMKILGYKDSAKTKLKSVWVLDRVK